jgi:Na+/H+ antiporter NhaD/arsenite permease-like protein
MNLLLCSNLAWASESAHHVPGYVTSIFGVILFMMILALALEEKIHAKKSIIVGVFAMFSLLMATYFQLLPNDTLENEFHEQVKIPIYIAAVDWGVIAIILGSSLFVDVTSRSGLFSWIAISLTKKSAGDPLRLLWFYGLMTVFFSAVLNNVTAMIIVGSLSVVSLERLKRRDLLLGFLLLEGLLTNIGGLLTLISSVPNIIVGTSAGIGFGTFFIYSAPFVFIATCATILMGAKRFHIHALKDDASKEEAKLLVSSFHEGEGITSKRFFYFSCLMLVLFVLCIALASALPIINKLGMGFVALSFGAMMLVRFKSTVDEFYQEIDWDLLGFFTGLFIVINVMEHAQVLATMGHGLTYLLSWGDSAGGAALLIASAVCSSVTDNIPLAAMLSKILGGLGTPADSSLWWSVIFGANLGGNLTPIGSASTLVAVTIIHKNKLEMSFVQFVKFAFLFALMQISLAVVYVLIVF